MPIFALIALALTSTLAVTLLLGKPAAEGYAVSIDFLPEDSSWVVKVYPVGSFFEAHVYHAGEFVEKAGGFTSIEEARGWGFARARGAA